jgi:hypothetical protein
MVPRVQGKCIRCQFAVVNVAQLCVCTEWGQCDFVQSDVLCWYRELVSVPVNTVTRRQARHNSTA